MSNQKILSKTWVVCLLAIGCCLLWGSAFPCIKMGCALFEISSDDSATIILYAGMRFTLAGILVIIGGSIIAKQFLKPRKSSIKKILFICLFQTVLQYIAFYIGIVHTTGVKSSIVFSANVFLCILISSLIFRMETLNAKKIIGCIIGFAGVIIVNLSGMDMSFALNGEGLVLVCALSAAISSVLIKKFSQSENPVMISGYQFTTGGIILMIIGYSFGGRINVFTTKGIAMLVYLAFISAVAYTVWGILLKYNPVSKVAVFGFMDPVFGVIFSTIILDEGTAINIKSITALILVCLGIYIVNKPENNINTEIINQ